LDATTGNRVIPLRCLNHHTAPEAVVSGWQSFQELPAAAREHIWDLLGPAIFDPTSANNARLLDGFCERHDTTPMQVVPAVNACDFLIGRAAVADLARSGFEQDLNALSIGAVDGVRMLCERYETIKQDLRQRLLQSALADHGKLLLGLRWRVDKMQATDRGAGLDADIIYLSMLYQEGGKTDQVSFQLTPTALKELKSFMDRFGN